MRGNKKNNDFQTIREGIFFVLFLLTMSLVIYTYSHAKAPNMKFDNEVVDHITQYEVVSEATNGQVTCPTFIPSLSGEKIVYTTVFTKNYPLSDSIMVRSSQQQMKVYLDGVLYLNYGNVQTSPFPMEPCSAWHISHIGDGKIQKGQELRIETISTSGIYGGVFRGIYVGTKAGFIYMILENAKSTLMITIPLFIIGLFFVALSLVFPEKRSKRKLFSLGIFGILTSLWLSLEEQVIQTIWGHLPSSFTFLFVLFSIIPVILVILSLNYKIFEKNIFMRISFWITLGCAVTFHVLNYTGIVSYMEDTNLIYFAFICPLLSFLFVLFDRKKSKKEDMDFFIGGFIFAVFGILELVDIFVMGEIFDDVALVKIGIMAFVTILGYFDIKKAVNDHNLMMEKEVWKKVAYTDVLTKLGNRLSFEERMAALKEENASKGYILMMADINDLKIINDVNGHATGDAVIAEVGTVLKEIFGDCGDCFRIGGDEFCVITGILSEEEFMLRQDKCCERLNHFGHEYGVAARVSCGHSVVDEEGMDVALSIADTRMYENKRIMKIVSKRKE